MAAEDFDIFIGSDNVIRLRGLSNGATPPGYYNAATVVANMYDPRGVLVTGPAWPVTLSYIPASDGNYDGNIEDTAAIAERSGYTLVVVATQGGVKRTFRRSGRGLWG